MPPCPPLPQTTYTLYNAGIAVNYDFDLFGGNRRALEVLAAEADYQGYELAGARLTLAANVVTTAFSKAQYAAEIDATRAILAGSTLFLLAVVGMGLLLSTYSRTQQQAFALNFFFVNPFFVLSGFAFPIAAMPKVLQWFTLINPLRYFLVVIRAVFLKGVGFAVLWPELAAMAALALVMLTISVLRFRASMAT